MVNGLWNNDCWFKGGLRTEQSLVRGRGFARTNQDEENYEHVDDSLLGLALNSASLARNREIDSERPSGPSVHMGAATPHVGWASAPAAPSRAQGVAPGTPSKGAKDKDKR
jgi:hypothetical protein